MWKATTRLYRLAATLSLHAIAAKHPADSSLASASASAPASSTDANSGSATPPVAQMKRQVDTLVEKLATVDKALRTQGGAVGLLQRQQAVSERRLASLEEAAGVVQGKVVNANRVAGEVALKVQNVELLMKQLEQRSAMTTATANTIAAGVMTEEEESNRRGEPQTRPQKATSQGSNAIKGEDEEEIEEVIEEVIETDELRSEIEAMVREAIAEQLKHQRQQESTLASTQRCMPPAAAVATTTTTTSPSPIAPPASPNSSISSDELRELHRAVATLTDRVESMQRRVDQLAIEQFATERVAPYVASSSSSGSGSSGESVLGAVAEATRCGNKSRLAALLRHSGAVPFKDAAGATSVSSERVLIRNVPSNIGAAEVRELCAGRVGGVISCVVRRCPIPAKPILPEASSLSKPSQTTPASLGRAAPLLRGDSLDDTPLLSDRAFEVTFVSAQHAIRALTALNGIALAANATQQVQKLVVEPVVSADILEALQELERVNGAGGTSTSC